MERMFFIPGNTASSKNSKVWTGRFLVWSKAAQKYRKESKTTFEDWAPQFREEFKKHSLPVKVSFKFVRKSKHKFDYVNPLQSVLDLMVEHNWLEDDNADIIHPVFEKYEYDKEKPGVYIKILNQ
jgi:Holliday junction resolvase RusA-like endonuclease